MYLSAVDNIWTIFYCDIIIKLLCTVWIWETSAEHLHWWVKSIFQIQLEISIICLVTTSSGLLYSTPARFWNGDKVFLPIVTTLPGSFQVFQDLCPALVFHEPCLGACGGAEVIPSGQPWHHWIPRLTLELPFTWAFLSICNSLLRSLPLTL